MTATHGMQGTTQLLVARHVLDYFLHCYHMQKYALAVEVAAHDEKELHDS